MQDFFRDCLPLGIPLCRNTAPGSKKGGSTGRRWASPARVHASQRRAETRQVRRANEPPRSSDPSLDPRAIVDVSPARDRAPDPRARFEPTKDFCNERAGASLRAPTRASPARRRPSCRASRRLSTCPPRRVPFVACGRPSRAPRFGSRRGRPSGTAPDLTPRGCKKSFRRYRRSSTHYASSVFRRSSPIIVGTHRHHEHDG